MRNGIIAAALVVVIAFTLMGALEVLPATVSCVAPPSEYNVVQTSTVVSTKTATLAVGSQETTTKTERVYNISPFVWVYNTNPDPEDYGSHNYVDIPPNNYAYQDTNLLPGMNVSVHWQANATVSVYVLNTTENARYAASNATATTPNIASHPLSSRLGSLSFVVPARDSYYLIFFNPNNGTKGLSEAWVELDNGSGVATWAATSTTTITQTTTTVLSVPIQVTSTQTTASSYRRTVDLLSQIEGAGCPQ